MSSDEPEDVKGGGDGKTKDDIVIAGDCLSVDLRSERQGGGNGRVYSVTLVLTDDAGNESTAICKVTVPHSQNGTPAVDDGAAAGYTETSSCVGAAPKLAAPSDDGAGEEILPEGYALLQNHPNPFNPSTTITFEVPEAGDVTLSVYNLRGQLIQHLSSGQIAAGRHSVVWDGTDFGGAKVASGVYVYKLQAKNFVATKKLIFTK